MKNLIILALDEAHRQAICDAPDVKYNVTKSDNVNGMSVNQLLSFIKENNIDPDALVSVDTESSDVSIHLNLYNEIPLTAKEEKDAVKGIFNRYAAMDAVRNMLRENGYKSKDVDRNKLKAFNDMSVYDMYMAEEFDVLVNYFSLFFDKINYLYTSKS